MSCSSDVTYHMEMLFNFIAGNSKDESIYNDLTLFADVYPDFQTVTLNNEDELHLLLEILEIKGFETKTLDSLEFDRIWDISDHKLPELNQGQFDEFYSDWLKLSGRDNNMDEFGQLVFLQGLTSQWNQHPYRLIVRENHP